MSLYRWFMSRHRVLGVMLARRVSAQSPAMWQLEVKTRGEPNERQWVV